MVKFSYKLVTKENKIVEGMLEAKSKKAAHETLSADGKAVLALERVLPHWLTKNLAFPSFGFPKIEQIHFFRNLATMLGAGMAIAEALRVLEDQVRSPGVKKAIYTITGNVENGKKLSEALRKFPRYFSEFVCESVSVGEFTGKITDVLDRISQDLEHDYELTRKVRGAMAYPIVVVAVMLIVVVGLSVFILPKIADLFTELEAALPLPTRILLGTGAFVSRYPFGIAASLLGLSVGMIVLIKNPRTRYGIHYAILKLPIFGELAREFNLARFFRALESLFRSGISLVRSVDIAKKTLQNDVYRRTLDAAHPLLIHGIPLTEALRPHTFLFPLQTRRIVEVGERTGKLEDVFARITGFYERALQHKTQMLASLVEPILILMIGIVVGGLALSVFLPIYQLSSIL